MLRHKHPPRILVVDDEATNLKVLRQVLQADYMLSFARSGADALKLARSDKPDLILLDIMMPEMTGFEVCAELKQDPITAEIPVIFVTALKDDLNEAEGFRLGAVDYISKPVVPDIVRSRVKTHLSLVRSDKLADAHFELIQKLARAAEYKDNETGMHVMRMSRYARIIGVAWGLDEHQAAQLLRAAPMHDIGKIGIPDEILLKPGRLTPEEFEVMKQHPQIGAEILGDSDSELIKLARSIALCHHEKWDGSGYPNGLAGEEISLEGRIVAIADVFDALTSKRPYKEAWSIEKTMALFREQSGSHFDPELVKLLEQNLDQIIEVKERWQD